jgi:hypothetical protein
VEWLFVVGVALEIAGALLVAASLLLPIVFRQWGKIALRGYLFPRGGPLLDDMREPAYAAVGAVLLVSGFSTQLAGYVVEFHRDALVALAVSVAVTTLVAGGLLAHFGVARLVLRKAVAHDRAGRDDESVEQH